MRMNVLPCGNQPRKINVLLFRYLPPEKCVVCRDLCVLARFIGYKWLRGQCETVGKSICIHLRLLGAAESANYFPAGLKALWLCWVAKKEVQPRTPAE